VPDHVQRVLVQGWQRSRPRAPQPTCDACTRKQLWLRLARLKLRRCPVLRLLGLCPVLRLLGLCPVLRLLGLCAFQRQLVRLRPLLGDWSLQLRLLGLCSFLGLIWLCPVLRLLGLCSIVGLRTFQRQLVWIWPLLGVRPWKQLRLRLGIFWRSPKRNVQGKGADDDDGYQFQYARVFLQNHSDRGFWHVINQQREM
jgi:hypothetical protein